MKTKLYLINDDYLSQYESDDDSEPCRFAKPADLTTDRVVQYLDSRAEDCNAHDMESNQMTSSPNSTGSADSTKEAIPTPKDRHGAIPTQPTGTASVTGMILKIRSGKTTTTYRWYRVKQRIPAAPWEVTLAKLLPDGFDSKSVYELQWIDGRWNCSCMDFIARRSRRRTAGAERARAGVCAG